MRSIYSEYNTDSGSGTYDRLQQVARHRTASTDDTPVEPLSISQRDLSNLICDLFRDFRKNVYTELSERATKRIQKPGRWKEISCSSLICEIVTDKLVRKGPLSDNGRLVRCEQIQRSVEQGCVRFVILLLPFRTPSPLKYRGVLPDLGEIYTIILLESVARACEHAQEILIAKVHVAANLLTYAQRNSYGLRNETSTPGKLNSKEIMVHVSAIIDEQRLTTSETAKRKRIIRGTLYNINKYEIHNVELFAGLLNILSSLSLSLETFIAFHDAKVVPVSILAVQDAERYPCYSDLSRPDIDNYREFLLGINELLAVERRYLDLVAYRDVARRIDEVAQKQRDTFYETRLRALYSQILNKLLDLYLCHGKLEFMYCLRTADPDGIVEPLFEPLLLSVQHPGIKEYALEWGIEYEEMFFRCMMNIYDPLKHERFEQLRRQLIQKTLAAVCQYCAAYEANTGAKNPNGFDDVSTCFPGTLRMSIHAKSESMGQFSIGVSPSKMRTPWHGTAALTGGNDGAPVALSIDLAGRLEATGKYAAVFVEDEKGCQQAAPFIRHASCRQPIFYLSVDFLSSAMRGGPGALWRELGIRGLRGLTRISP